MKLGSGWAAAGIRRATASMDQPQIKSSVCFQCGHCSEKSGNVLFCERHHHVWKNLMEVTKVQAHIQVLKYNNTILPSVKDRKKLQMYINRLVVMDDLNRYSTNTHVDQVYIKSLETDVKFTRRMVTLLAGCLMCVNIYYEGFKGFWKFLGLTFCSALVSVSIF